jgi:hypothetical protein
MRGRGPIPLALLKVFDCFHTLTDSYFIKGFVHMQWTCILFCMYVSRQPMQEGETAGSCSEL